MAAETLLDTGVLVGLLDASEGRHAVCVDAFRRCRGPLLSTEAVLTESLYLLSESLEAQEACLEMFLRGAVVLVPTSVEDLARVKALMRRYRSLPMDYADASLVALAEVVGTGSILTLDRRGFGVYRWRTRRSFEMAP